MAERIFERKIYQKMLKWKKDSNGKQLFLLKGQDVLENLLLLRSLLKKNILAIY